MKKEIIKSIISSGEVNPNGEEIMNTKYSNGDTSVITKYDKKYKIEVPIKFLYKGKGAQRYAEEYLSKYFKNNEILDSYKNFLRNCEYWVDNNTNIDIKFISDLIIRLYSPTIDEFKEIYDDVIETCWYSFIEERAKIYFNDYKEKIKKDETKIIKT